MGASNSSKIQQTINQDIENNAEQWGKASASAICIITNSQITSKGCQITVTNKCFAKAEIIADQIFDAAVSATAEAASEQSAAMIAFLTNNSSDMEQTLNQTFKTNVSNSCEVIANTNALIEGIRINAESCPASGIVINNLSDAKAQCTLAQTSNTIADADLVADTQQQTSLLGGTNSGSGESSDGGGMMLVFLVVSVVIGAVVFMLLLKFLKKK